MNRVQLTALKTDIAADASANIVQAERCWLTRVADSTIAFSDRKAERILLRAFAVVGVVKATGSLGGGAACLHDWRNGRIPQAEALCSGSGTARNSPTNSRFRIKPNGKYSRLTHTPVYEPVRSVIVYAGTQIQDDKLILVYEGGLRKTTRGTAQLALPRFPVPMPIEQTQLDGLLESTNTLVMDTSSTGPAAAGLVAELTVRAVMIATGVIAKAQVVVNSQLLLLLSCIRFPRDASVTCRPVGTGPTKRWMLWCFMTC